jgi:hypothetical protein
MRGGIHRYRCLRQNGKCDQPTFEQFAWENDTLRCPTCKGKCERVVHSRKHPGLPYDQPVLSDSMGVSPDQVEEHRRVHPNIEMNNEGQVVIRSHNDYAKVRRQLGFIDTSKR